MSIPISRLQATIANPGDYYLVNQGIPPVTRLAKGSDILLAATNSSGTVGTVPIRNGPVRIQDLQITTTVYLNDTMFCDQGTPPITRLATVAQVLAASGSGPANAEYTGRPIQDKLISGLPVASTVYANDYFVVNQLDRRTGGQVTRRAPWPPGSAPAPAPAPCSPVFLDNFDGTVGTALTAHTPDIYPTGFRWILDTPGNIKLDGAGRAVLNAGILVAQSYDYGDFAPQVLASKFVVTMTCKMPG